VEQLLSTKLYIPPTRPELVARPRLIERLNAGLHHKLTIISASAGFGKTTLVSEWLAGCQYPAAWLSLDEGLASAFYVQRCFSLKHL
jgi:LuxR family transcriptional regulator, maltose regulon positive regulatory protein